VSSFADTGRLDSAQVRLRSRRVEAKPRSRRRILLLVAALVLIMIALAAVLYFSPIFSIDDVQIQGTQRLDSETLKTQAAVPDTTLPRLDQVAVVKRLEQNVWIEDAQVSLEFPHTVVIKVSERQPLAVANLASPTASGGVDPWLLSADGIWLGSSLELAKLGAAVTSSQVQALPQIVSLPGSVSAAIGQSAGDAQDQSALKVLSAFDQDFRNGIANIDVTNVSDLKIKLRNNIEIDFGDSSLALDKEKAIVALELAHPNSLTYVNVRTPATPTYRALR
jgi:cell division protein FtsQ